MTVGDLRAAATEAGISTLAFDAALAELRAGGQAQVAAREKQRRRFPRVSAITAGAVAAFVALSAIVVSRTVIPTSDPPTVEETFLLRCLAPNQAAALLRPLLDLPTNTVVISPDRAAPVVTIRATPAQMVKVRATLDQYDGTGSSACATR
jgi:hypothetical protein